jgi:hypothetical protein
MGFVIGSHAFAILCVALFYAWRDKEHRTRSLSYAGVAAILSIGSAATVYLDWLWR